MKSWLHKYDMNVFLSDDYRDINFARDCGVQNITVIPNGAAEEEFSDEPKLDLRELLGIPYDHFLILHVGSHTGVKGHAEALKIFAKARIKNATFLLAANDFGCGCKTSCRLKEKLFNHWPRHKCEGKRLLVTSLSREEVVAAFKEADLFLFPSNIECSPLVLFECMASGTPFLSTDVGNAREIVRWSQSGAILPTRFGAGKYSYAEVKGSAGMLEKLYQDRDRRERMAESGFGAWRERFTWGRVARAYEELYKGLVEGA
jgi:glycosyltransferase involved in cell wall biosynthesis